MASGLLKKSGPGLTAVPVRKGGRWIAETAARGKQQAYHKPARELSLAASYFSTLFRRWLPVSTLFRLADEQ